MSQTVLHTASNQISPVPPSLWPQDLVRPLATWAALSGQNEDFKGPKVSPFQSGAAKTRSKNLRGQRTSHHIISFCQHSYNTVPQLRNFYWHLPTCLNACAIESCQCAVSPGKLTCEKVQARSTSTNQSHRSWRSYVMISNDQGCPILRFLSVFYRKIKESKDRCCGLCLCTEVMHRDGVTCTLRLFGRLKVPTFWPHRSTWCHVSCNLDS